MLDQIRKQIENEAAVALYFKASRCSVCEILEPKVKDLLTTDFPKFSFLSFLQNENTAALAAHFNVFHAPTLLLFLEEKKLLELAKTPVFLN